MTGVAILISKPSFFTLSMNEARISFFQREGKDVQRFSFIDC